LYAHRAMYEQEVGPIPDGFTIDHLCSERACMNPAHLEAVSMATNLQRGRGAKLTEEDVRSIRAAPESFSNKDLALWFGISDSQLSRIRRGKRWRSVSADTN
jgi:hypothetical protein